MDLGTRIASVTVTGALLVLAGHALTAPDVVRLDPEGWTDCAALKAGASLPDRVVGCTADGPGAGEVRVPIRHWACRQGPRLFAWEQAGRVSFTVNGLIQPDGSPARLRTAVQQCTGTPTATRSDALD